MTTLPTNQLHEGYLSGPAGIVTVRGTVFRTTESDLASFAGALLDRRPLGKLLADAECWLDFPKNATVWLLPAFVLAFGPLGLLISLLSYTVLVLVRTPLTAWSATGLARLLGSVGGQAVMYVAVAGWLGAQSEYASMAACLSGFVALRWSLVDQLLGRFIEGLGGGHTAVSAADRVLRALIVRGAIRYGVVLNGMKPIHDRFRAVVDSK